MTRNSRIVRVEFRALDIPMRVSFSIAGGAQDVARNVLVTVVLEDGTRGFGEAAPFPAVSGETQESTLLALEDLEPLLVGEDARAWRLLAAQMDAEDAHAAAARCALETAILDALTEQAGMSLLTFFGGASGHLDTGMTITTGTVEDARTATRDVLARGIGTLKVKVGAGDEDLDVARVLAIRDVAPRATLWLDGNGGFDAPRALGLLATLERHGIVPRLFEQPVPGDDLEGLAEVTRGTRVLVCSDESARSAADVARLAKDGAAGAVNVKIMKCGIAEALDMSAVARAAGLELMIGGMVESALAMTVSGCLAAGRGGFRFIDLDTPMFLATNPFTGGYVQDGARLVFTSIRSGHGVRPI